ncbi:hypothetical protein TNCV_2940831 [Trichonephila clavipes]|nr:hypothetical protein TNCV_2940831 [Trichonephila clavipes]
MSRSGSQSEAIPPVFKSPSKLCIHLSTHWCMDERLSRSCPSRNRTRTRAIHEPIQFLLLHKTGSAGQPGHVSLIETSDNPREQVLENTAGGVGLLISTFPSMSWPLLQHGVEHCHAVKSLYHVSRCIAAVCLSMLGSNALIASDNDRL